jgi:hypothetical protein
MTPSRSWPLLDWWAADAREERLTRDSIDGLRRSGRRGCCLNSICALEKRHWRGFPEDVDERAQQPVLAIRFGAESANVVRTVGKPQAWTAVAARRERFQC